jgi:hypothetical protein
MMTNSEDFLEGGCSCGHVRYKMEAKPLIVHCCHCSVCQRQNGSAFAVNALIEADRVNVTKGDVQNSVLESPSGSGQRFARCPKCQVAVWSEYLMMTGGVTDLVYFIRVGTLDKPDRLPPDVHIHIASKQPWVALPEGALAFDGSYRGKAQEVWSADSLKRLDVL